MRQSTLERTPDTPDELWLCEHAPVYTQGLAGKADHVLNPGDIPVVPDRPRRPGHLPRPGPGGGLSADRPAARRLLRQGIRLPDRGVGDPHAGALRRHRPPRGRRARHLRAAGRPVLACRADRPDAPGRPVPRPRQDRRAGHQGQPPLHLPRRGAQRGDGPGTLHAHQPLRLRGAENGRSFYNRRSNHLGRSRAGAGQQAQRLPRA